MQAPRHPKDSEDQARLIVAVVLSLLVLFGFHHFYEKPRAEQLQKQQQIEMAQKKAAVAVSGAESGDIVRTRAEVVADTQRIPVTGKKISGSVSLKGARIDDLLLSDQFTAVGSKENVALLSPSGTLGAYYVENGWLFEGKDIAVPAADTVWSMAPGSPAEIVSGGPAVTLQWDNGQGVVFEQDIALDDNYLFTVTQRVKNNTANDVKFNTYHLAARSSLPVDFEGFFVLHEGPVGYLGGKLHEPDYKELDEGEKIELSGTEGWLGITDKYWLVGLLPEPGQKINARVIGSSANGKPHYQTDIVSAVYTTAPGQSAEGKIHVYAGVKNLHLIQAYEKQYGFKSLDLSIDFGIWYFITKPFFFLFHFLSGFFGNIGLAILGMTVLVRAAVYPLADKSFRSMAKMKSVTPQLKELQEKYGKDKEKLQAEIYSLYAREKVNPFSGCWPIFVQIPIFFALYKVILISVELRHAPFWGWIDDLSAPDPTSMFNLFGLIPWAPPSFLMIGAWPLLFCLTMILQKRISPPLPDKTQEQLQGMFPYVITFMLAHFASGLVIYWTWSNVLGILQQYYILKTVGGEDTSLIRGHRARRKKKD